MRTNWTRFGRSLLSLGLIVCSALCCCNAWSSTCSGQTVDLIGSKGIAKPADGQVKSQANTAFYEPALKDVEGWSVKLEPVLLSKENKARTDLALKALANHLQRVKFILPADKVAQLQKFPIWVESAAKGGLVYHPSAGWLEKNGMNPAMAKHVHVPNCDHLVDPQQWAKHPYAIVHELAHAYHDQVLGFSYPEIKTLFSAAKDSKTYEQVLSHDHRTVNHYALSNHKEYFAESTEAYLGVNDFYPFVRAELKQHDPKMYRLQEKIWGKIR